jgi:excisionase family DNA binding protein
VSDNLLTAEQVATLLGTTPRHVRRLVFERRIAYHKLGRYVRFHPDDVAEYVAAIGSRSPRRLLAGSGQLAGGSDGLRRGPAGQEAGPGGRPRWRARWRDPAGRERSKSFARKVDAEQFLLGIEDAKLRGAYVDPAAGRVGFTEQAERWFATTAALRPSTRHD